MIISNQTFKTQSLSEKKKIKQLRIYNCHFSIIELYELSKFENLQILIIEKSRIKNGASINIFMAQLFNLPKLKALQLEGCNYFTESKISKINKRSQPSLEKLIFNGQVTGKHLFTLNKNIGWQMLKSLELRNQNIQMEENEFVEGFSNICTYEFRNLTQLKLSYFDLSKIATKHITKAKWDNLQTLQLQQCNLQDESIKIICKCHWKNLKRFQINFNPLVTDKSIEAIADNFGIKIDFSVELAWQRFKPSFKTMKTLFVDNYISKSTKTRTHLIQF